MLHNSFQDEHKLLQWLISGRQDSSIRAIHVIQQSLQSELEEIQQVAFLHSYGIRELLGGR